MQLRLVFHVPRCMYRELFIHTYSYIYGVSVVEVLKNDMWWRRRSKGRGREEISECMKLRAWTACANKEQGAMN